MPKVIWHAFTNDQASLSMKLAFTKRVVKSNI